MAESDNAVCARNIDEQEEERPILRAAPAGRLVSPEEVAQMVKDSVDRGEPNRELNTASKYLLLAAMNICTEAVRSYSGYLEHFQTDEAEYWALDAKRAMNQTSRVLDVLAEIEGLELL